MTDTLTIRDNRNEISYELPIEHDALEAAQLRRIGQEDNGGGLVSYDPGLKNTAAAKSAITFIDGDEGVLRYRGYPIEQLVERSHFLETAYLVLFGELPGAAELDEWQLEIAGHAQVDERIRELLHAFRPDADPMGTLVSSIAALGTFFPQEDALDLGVRQRQIKRLVAKVPTLAAFAFRTRRGLPLVYPDRKLGFAGNFLKMMFHEDDGEAWEDPIVERALDTLLLLHIDHEQNCSANVMRAIGSSLANPYLATAGAAAALAGPLHGGANQAVVTMLDEIEGPAKVPEFIEGVKAGERRLMGFGHRVYKNYDPRAAVIKEMVGEVFEVTGRERLHDVALEVERVALEDEYFVSRNLYPNVDFYSGILYRAMGFPKEMFPVLFAIARTVGWLAQWSEMLDDDEQKIARPKQIYVGPSQREYVPIGQR